MTDWIFDIFEENLNKIRGSGKEVEGRVPDLRNPGKHYHKIVSGDKVVFRVVDKQMVPIQDNTLSVQVDVSYNRKYSSVKEMLEGEGISRTLPGINSIEEGIAVYHNLPGYEERIKQNGIHAIGLAKKL